MINIKQNNNVYEVSFPYDAGIVDIVKSVPGKCWLPNAKMWTIPKEHLGFLLNELKGTRYEPLINIVSDEHINENADIDKTTEIPDIDLTDVPFYVQEGSKPFSHQLDFMKWCIAREQSDNLNGFLLADEMGCGKSIELINLAIYNKEHYGFKHCLIICCTNSAKYNWMDEIRKHTNGEYEPYLIGSRLKKSGDVKFDTTGKDKCKDLITWKKYSKDCEQELPYFIIMNIEALRYTEGRQYAIADAIINKINSGEINMIALDEIHKNASAKSQQGKQLLRIKKYTKQNCMWIPMTGTPITKQPMDVFVPLRLCEGHTVESYYKWCQYFCIYGGFGDHVVLGYRNIPRLKNILQHNMIRRLKDDVLDLPPKIHYTEYVENTPYQRKLYTQVANDIINNKDEIMLAVNPMTKLLKLRQVNGSPELVDTEISPNDSDYLKKNARLVRLLELLEEAHERGEKTVVFSNWVEPLRTLYTFISKKYKTCVFTGTMSAQDREKHKKTFIENPNYTVLLGTIGAAGTAHTFTVARNVIFYDVPWNPSDKEQAEDRCHRAGTTQSVNIFTLVAKDTIDDKVEQILSTKSGISKYIVDGRIDLSRNPELFDLLLAGGK